MVFGYVGCVVIFFWLWLGALPGGGVFSQKKSYQVSFINNRRCTTIVIRQHFEPKNIKKLLASIYI